MGIPAPTTILKFVLAAAVGIGATLGIAAATQSGPKSTAVAGPETLYQAAASDAPVAFTTQAAVKWRTWTSSGRPVTARSTTS